MLAPDFHGDAFFAARSIHSGIAVTPMTMSAVQSLISGTLMASAVVHFVSASTREERSVPHLGMFVVHFGPSVAQEPMLQSTMPACIADMPECIHDWDKCTLPEAA